MIAFSGTEEFQIQEPTVVTIGKFDGRHVGHQKLLNCMLEWKKRRGYQTAVFTFDMSPAVCLTGLPQKVITTNQERRDNMEKMGIDYLVEYPFTREASHLPPEEFLKKILLGRMNARTIVAGTDCDSAIGGPVMQSFLSGWRRFLAMRWRLSKRKRIRSTGSSAVLI